MSFHMIYKLSLCCIYSSISRFECKIKGGGQILGWMYARGGGGGGSFRCILCATGGVGGSKTRGKLRM